MASGWVTSLSSETTPTLAFLLHFRVGFSLLVSVAPVSMLTILRRQLFMCSTGLCSNFSCNSEKKTRYLVKLICISSRKGKQNWRIVDQYFSNGIHCNSLIKTTLFFLHLQMNVRIVIEYWYTGAFIHSLFPLFICYLLNFGFINCLLACFLACLLD